MNTTHWILIAGLLLFLWLGMAVVNELKRISLLLTELLGELAQPLWRIKDELTELNKHQKN